MTQVFNIRPANTEDIDALVGLEKLFPASDQFSRDNWRRLLKANGATLVATHKGQVCGAILVLFRKGSKIARIYTLSVSPDMRGKGVGPALLSAADEEGRRRGCLETRLEVRESNTPAISLYERHGYSVMARATQYYPGGEDALRMSKAL